MVEEYELQFNFESEIDDFITVFIESTSPWWLTGQNARSEVVKELSDSFTGVNSLNELGEDLFWRQINEARRRYPIEIQKRIRALRAIVYFYVFVIKNRPELNLFSESRTLYPSLLENRSFVTEWLEDRFVFMTFHPGLSYDYHDRFIFILRGAEYESSKLRSTDYIKVDLTYIASAFYRKCVFDYICSDIDRIKNFYITVYSFPLNSLSELKGADGYKNSTESVLLSSESAFVMEKIRKKSNGKETSIAALSSMIRSFFEWCVGKHYLIVDDTFFDGLSFHRKRTLTSKITRPEASVLNTLLKASKCKAEVDPDHYLVHDAVMRLLLTTNLRISDICGLKRDCVRASMVKPGSFLVHISKTAYGDEEEKTITPRDKALIDKVLAFNEKLLKSAAPEIRDYLFLYVPNRKQYVRVPDKFSFYQYMKALCRECDIPRTVATHLRKEYQSQVKSFIIKEGRDEVDYKALSGHAHTETTDKHYVKIRIEEYFLQMYQVELGVHHDEVKTRIVDSVPAELERVGDTYNRCGACNSSHCIAKLALPCFLCKDFITSKEFLPVFKKMVDEVSDTIVSSVNPHDKEDLTAIKSVLVSYIIELSKIA